MKIREVASIILHEKLRRKAEKRAAQLKQFFSLTARAVRRMADGTKHHVESKAAPYSPPA